MERNYEELLSKGINPKILYISSDCEWAYPVYLIRTFNADIICLEPKNFFRRIDIPYSAFDIVIFNSYQTYKNDYFSALYNYCLLISPTVMVYKYSVQRKGTGIILTSSTDKFKKKEPIISNFSVKSCIDCATDYYISLKNQDNKDKTR